MLLIKRNYLDLFLNNNNYYTSKLFIIKNKPTETHSRWSSKQSKQHKELNLDLYYKTINRFFQKYIVYKYSI